ncbi:MAG: hypothetical protein ACRD12_04040 [Acidimicrobiales bacterium]
MRQPTGDGNASAGLPRHGRQCAGCGTSGTSRNDVTYGTSGADRIAAFGGNDIVFGLAGDDQLAGGDGDDTICGAEVGT